MEAGLGAPSRVGGKPCPSGLRDTLASWPAVLADVSNPASRAISSRLPVPGMFWEMTWEWPDSIPYLAAKGSSPSEWRLGFQAPLPLLPSAPTPTSQGTDSVLAPSLLMEVHPQNISVNQLHCSPCDPEQGCCVLWLRISPLLEAM